MMKNLKGRQPPQHIHGLIVRIINPIVGILIKNIQYAHQQILPQIPIHIFSEQRSILR